MWDRNKPPNMGIKPYNPLLEQRQLYELKKQASPGYGPLNIPRQPQAPVAIHPMQFQRLRAALGSR